VRLGKGRTSVRTRLSRAGRAYLRSHHGDLRLRLVVRISDGGQRMQRIARYVILG
jgi:hypothetical protein